MDIRAATFAEALDSAAWHLLRGEFVHQIRALSRMLIENVDLDEGKRRGYQVAVAELKRGIRSVYEKAGRELPTALRQELDFYTNDED